VKTMDEVLAVALRGDVLSAGRRARAERAERAERADGATAGEQDSLTAH
jgi:hypothetical protein